MAQSFKNSPVIADIISRLITVESAQGALPTPTEYDAIADLRAETVYSNTDRALVSAPINGNVYIYVFNDSVTDADNGETILTPDDITEPSAGRWVADVSLSIVGHAHDDKANRITEPQQGKFLESDENGDPVESEYGSEDFSLEGHGHENYLDETDKTELEQSVQGVVDTVANKMNKLTGLASGHIGSIPFIREDGHLDPSTIKATNIPSSDEKAGIVGLTGDDPAAKVSQINAILALLSSDDTTLDELQEIVAYIKLNRSDLDALSVSSIIGLQEALDLKLGDAPEDDYSYVRHNGEWVKEGSVVQVESTSRTIYVETTGDDETGDGSTVGTAFATFGRALKDIKSSINTDTTIQLGIGAFSISASDLVLLGNLKGVAAIKILGTINSVYSGLTITHTGNLEYSITEGGSPTAFTDNEYQGFFVKRSSLYLPINTNGASTLELPEAKSGYDGNIYEVQTVLDITLDASIYMTFNTYVEFQNLKFNLINASYKYLYLNSASGSGYAIRLIECVFTSTNYSTLLFSTQNVVDLRRCHIEEITLQVNIGCILSSNLCSYVMSSSTKYSVFISSGLLRVSGGNIFRGNGFYALYFAVGELAESSTSGMYYKFSSFAAPFRLAASAKCRFHINSVLIIESVSYLIGFLNSGFVDRGHDFRIDISIVGEPSTAWYQYNPSAFLNYPTGSVLYVSQANNLEEGVNLSATLTNATVTDITVGNKTQNRSIIVDYIIERNTLFEEGQLRILYNGTTLQFLQPSDLKQDNNSGSGIGATFDVDFDSTDTDLINLGITLDSGDDATFKYNVKRTML